MYLSPAANFPIIRWAGCGFLTMLCLGCGGGPPKPTTADIDPDAVAVQGVELYDGNQDGAIDAAEATAKCPPLSVVFAAVDADSDGKITAAELRAHVAAAASAGNMPTSLDCTVMLGGRPLAGALVKLRPAELYNDALLPAEGTTDAQGFVRPSIGDANLPANLAGAALMYPGLYHVEITHPQVQIPARYNTASELGAELNPLSRTGVAVQFDLKSN